MRLLKYIAVIITLVATGCLMAPIDDLSVGEVVTLKVLAVDAGILLNDSTSANGLSVVRLRATIGELVKGGQALSFTTSAGLLYDLPYTDSAEGTNTLVVTPGGKVADVLLITNAGINRDVIVSVTMDSKFKAIQTVNFGPSCPEDLYLTVASSRLQLSVSDTMVVMANLFRELGTVSEDIRVDFEVIALDIAMAEIGRVTFAENQKATSVLRSLNNTPGMVQVIATVTSPQACVGALTDTLDITIE